MSANAPHVHKALVVTKGEGVGVIVSTRLEHTSRVFEERVGKSLKDEKRGLRRRVDVRVQSARQELG